MTKRTLVDTGPLVAILCPDDEHHESCASELQRHTRPLLTGWPVITEAAWLVRNEPEGIARLLGLAASEVIEIIELGEDAPVWISEFVQRYQSVRAQVADAALVYLAEQLAIDSVFTTDRRDFSVYRLTDGRSFRVIPEGT